MEGFPCIALTALLNRGPVMHDLLVGQFHHLMNECDINYNPLQSGLPPLKKTKKNERPLGDGQFLVFDFFASSRMLSLNKILKSY